MDSTHNVNVNLKVESGKIDYARELNDQQFAAVTSPPGPSLVIAGAGSGKTRTLTYRVAFLLENGVAPDQILLLTFTNKAAKEMLRRVKELVGSELEGMYGGTFHSVGARILRSFSESVGYKRNFGIIDREDSLACLKACIESLSDPTQKTKAKLPSAEETMEAISKWLNGNHRHDITKLGGEWFQKVYAAYTERKLESQLMDFDDLLVMWHRLLKESIEVREYLQTKFQFILVDEYQDTNLLQGEIVETLAMGHNNLMVVGDDAQSIYSWRGANLNNILEFPKRHPATRVYRIEENYRSSPQILAVANAVIVNNFEQFRKELRPVMQDGEKPGIVACQDAGRQSNFVVSKINEALVDGVPANEIAVLYRAHFHTLELQMALQRAGIPFSVTSGIRFFEQAHIKDVTAFLKWLANPKDEISFKRLVKMFPGVGEKATEKLWNEMQPKLDALVEAEYYQSPGQSLAVVLATSAELVPKRAQSAWAALAATFSEIQGAESNLNPADLIRLFVRNGYQDYLGEVFENAEIRLEELDGFATFAAEFAGLHEFLTQVSLLTNVESESRTEGSGQQLRVRLSTIHQAKGLEFDHVFVIMLGEELFPSARSVESNSALEEERRLFYVAVTRARRKLFLSYPLCRVARGLGMMAIRRSRFLDEIPKQLLQVIKLPSYSRWD